MRALTLGVAVAAALIGPASAQHDEPKLPPVAWSFDGPFGTFDRASAQRGFQVYQQVCSNCHSMRLMYYRNLEQLGLSEEQVKAIAAEVTVPGGTNDQGEPVERPGLPSDPFKSPFPNDKAARAANNGALPPDLSLITKARSGGADYVHGLLNGYVDPPAGTKVPEGQYYNLYFPGHFLAMPPPLSDGQVQYVDGTKATVDQMSKDVAQFLQFAAEPYMERRKQLGVKVMLFTLFLAGLTFGVKRKIWKDIH